MWSYLWGGFAAALGVVDATGLFGLGESLGMGGLLTDGRGDESVATPDVEVDPLWEGMDVGGPGGEVLKVDLGPWETPALEVVDMSEVLRDLDELMGVPDVAVED